MPKPLNVLILEDNPTDAELLLIELRRAGFDPTSQIVDNEKDFTAHLKPELDLILSDYNLPQFVGLQALQLRNESGYDIPFILVSGTIGEEVAVESIQQGADDYLMKDRLKRLGTAVANAIKKKESRDEKKQAQLEIETLLELSRQASAETDLDNLLFFIADKIVQVISPAEASAVFLYDQERKVVRIQAWAGHNDRDVKGIEFKVAGSQIGRIFRARKPAIIKNVSEDPDFRPIDKPGAGEIKSQIIVPLIYKKRVIGIIYADNLTRTDAFSQKNLDLLESIGNQVTGTIENARLLDQVRESHKLLSQSEERLVKAQQLGRLGFMEQNLKTKHIFLSDETYRIFGFKIQDDLITHNKIFKLIHPDDRELVQKNMNSLIKNGGKTNFDYRIVHPDGKIRWVNKQSKITFDADGTPEKILGTILDITERMKTAETLGKSEEKFRLLAENSIDCIWMLDSKLRFTYLSPSAEKILGYKPEQLVGTKLSSHFTKKEFLKVGVLAAKAIAKYKTFTDATFETKMLNSKNEEVDIEISSKTLLNDQGELIGLQGISKDITARKQAQEILLQSEMSYRSVADDSPGLINRYTLDGTITFVNQESCRFFGKTYQELIGTNIQSTIPEKDRESVMSNIASLTAESPIQVFDTHVLRFDSEVRWVRWTNRALFDDKGQKSNIQSFGQDITEQVQAQKKEQRHLDNIAFLSETAMQFVDFDPQEDIYRFIGERLRELTGESIVVVNSIDRTKSILTTRAIVGMGKYAKDIMKLIGRSPEGIEYDVNNENLAYLTDGKLHDYKEGLYEIFLRTVSKPTCYTIEKLFHLKKIYTIGFVQNKRLFGTAGIFLSRDIDLESIETIKLFIEQASIAIQHKQAEQALHQERDKAQKYLDIAGVVLVVLNKKGEIDLINQRGCQMLGYKEDELIGVNWFDTCLPERDRKEVKQVFRKLIAEDTELVEFYENLILTKSGEERTIAWHNTILLDDDKSIIGTLGSGEDITAQVRAEQLLNALNRAAVSIGTAQTHHEIFNAVTEEFKQLDISCVLLPLDEARDELIIKYVSFESALLDIAERLTGVDYRDFSFPVDAVDMFREVVNEKKTLFSDHSEQVLRQILPKSIKKLSAHIIKIVRAQRSITTPLIVEDKVIGVFSIQSGILTRGDIPVATAFADQLASAWNKIELLQNLRKTVEGTIRAVAATVEARDPYTAGHQTRVSGLAAAIAKEMHLTDEQVEGVRMAGIVHDLGKINIPAEILSKPGKLSELEFNLIKTHPQNGFDLLKDIEFPWPIAEIVLQHHEKMDGSGYPQGLKGEEILLEARILCVADIVEAMSSHRPYRPSLGIEKALAQIKMDKGTLLDPKVVDTCLKIFNGGYQLLEN